MTLKCQIYIPIQKMTLKCQIYILIHNQEVERNAINAHLYTIVRPRWVDQLLNSCIEVCRLIYA